MSKVAPVVALSHGGGPMPILGDPKHKDIVYSLKNRVPKILKLGTPDQPRAIILVTAHWSTAKPTISSGASHKLLYDYYGFPRESYSLKYPAPGHPEIANEIADSLREQGLTPELDDERGWDHGVFIPLLLVNPKADIPVVQVSVLESEDPEQHLRMGAALRKLRANNIAVVGSGFASFHNIRAMMMLGSAGPEQQAQFRTLSDEWNNALTDATLKKDTDERWKALKSWRGFPYADMMHPPNGGEHFMPLLVCAGAAREGEETKKYSDEYVGVEITGSMGQHYKPSIDADVVKVFVLETDTPHPDTQNERGSFGEILHSHFSKAGSKHHPPLGVETEQVFVVTEEGGRIPKVEEFEDYDGLLITGSMYDAHGDNQWIHELLDLLKQLWIKRPDFHFTGVCFGHQLLSRLLGGKVGPSPTNDWELGHNAIKLTPVGKRLFRTHDDKIYLHQMHQDQVLEAPSAESSNGLLDPDTDVHIWGTSSHTSVQGLYIPNRLFTSQAHLAFDEDMVKRQIQMRIDSGGIKDMEHADRAAETANLEHDGEEVAAAILRLFRYDDDGMSWD
ncbi:hypothetical protein F53441_50 [Fusarium austroafricanum]|uniref:Glutamine amidotransferase domain-containing protein n=1 Tax=Fusarium austroafricanum TaxID=2364996 RepID=A0A8H4KZ05_9HYPO|nr:hypothetical protein F53441_50 [Fusarium austroafricanum]